MNPKSSRFYTYIKPFVKNRYVKTYSSLVFSLIAMTIFAIFAIRPTILTILDLNKNIEEQKSTLKKLEEKESQLEILKENLQKIDSQTTTALNTVLPDNPALPHFMDVMSSLSDRYQASVSGLQFQPTVLNASSVNPQTIGTTSEIEFTINLNGSYSSLVNLLQTLNQTDRLIKIVTVNFNKPEDINLIISVNGNTVYLKY